MSTSVEHEDENTERNALIAEKIMGWKRTDPDSFFFRDDDGEIRSTWDGPGGKGYFNPSTDLNHCAEAEEKIWEQDNDHTLRYPQLLHVEVNDGTDVAFPPVSKLEVLRIATATAAERAAALERLAIEMKEKK